MCKDVCVSLYVNTHVCVSSTFILAWYFTMKGLTWYIAPSTIVQDVPKKEQSGFCGRSDKRGCNVVFITGIQRFVWRSNWKHLKGYNKYT